MTSNSLTENEEHGIPSQILKTIFGLHASLFFIPQYVWFPVHLKGLLTPLWYKTVVVNWQNWLFTLFHQSRSVLSPNPITNNNSYSFTNSDIHKRYTHVQLSCSTHLGLNIKTIYIYIYLVITKFIITTNMYFESYFNEIYFLVSKLL